MINFDENKTKHFLKWPYISYHQYRILIIGGSASGKTNALLNLIDNQPDIDKIYLQCGPPKCPYFSLLIVSKKIITDSLFSGILQTRPVEVVWHQDGCCSPIFNAKDPKFCIVTF